MSVHPWAPLWKPWMFSFILIDCLIRGLSLKIRPTCICYHLSAVCPGKNWNSPRSYSCLPAKRAEQKSACVRSKTLLGSPVSWWNWRNQIWKRCLQLRGSTGRSALLKRLRAKAHNHRWRVTPIRLGAGSSFYWSPRLHNRSWAGRSLYKWYLC